MSTSASSIETPRPPAHVLLQAGHYPNGGGAPGEARWTYQLAHLLAARLDDARVSAVVIGDFYAQPAPPQCARDYDLFVALHYDAAIYASRGERNSGCFADRAADETRPTEADRFIRTWERVYPSRTGIPLANQRRNPNTNRYYAFAALSAATPGVLIEHGCGAPVGTGTFPPGEDAAFLHERIDVVADADAVSIVEFLQGRAQVTALPAGAADTPEVRLKAYFEQLGQPVNLDTAIIRRAALAHERGETRGPALSGEYRATTTDGKQVIRQDFTAGIAEYHPDTGDAYWVEVVLHPDTLRTPAARPE